MFLLFIIEYIKLYILYTVHTNIPNECSFSITVIYIFKIHIDYVLLYTDQHICIYCHIYIDSFHILHMYITLYSTFYLLDEAVFTLCSIRNYKHTYNAV